MGRKLRAPRLDHEDRAVLATVGLWLLWTAIALVTVMAGAAVLGLAARVFRAVAGF